MADESGGGPGRLFVNQREERLRAGWRLAAVVPAQGAAWVMGGLVFVALIEVAPQSGPFASIAVTAGLLAVYGAIAATVVAMVRWIDRRPWNTWVDDPAWPSDLAAGFVIGIGMTTTAVLAGLVSGHYRVADILVVDPSAPVLTAADVTMTTGETPLVLAVLLLLVMHVAVGVSEELLIRGYLLTNLAEGLAGVGRVGARGALAFAALATSLLFGVLHLANPGAGFVSTANIVLAGLFFAGTYVATGSLAIPIGLHIAWNFALAGVYGLPVSGLGAGGSLLAVESVGDAAVTGGGFGPEAGFVFYPALVVGVLASLAWIRYARDRVVVHEEIARYVPPASVRGNPDGG